MKKTRVKVCLTLALCLMISVTVLADAQKGKTEPDIITDYYMIVESREGGINMYANPDLESTKLNETLIPNGTALHIEGEVEDTPHRRTWGYAEYHGMMGFAPLDDCRPAASRKEAIDSELYIAGRDHVHYDTDYEVTANAEAGTQKLYQGPGEKYGPVPGVREIENGEILSITQDAELVDGARWGVTSIDGKNGWVNLDQTEEAKSKNEISEASESQASAAEKPTVTPAKEVSPTATEKPTVTPVKEVSPTATEKPTVTPVKEVSPTATEKPTVTPVKEVSPTATEKPTVTPAKEASPTPEEPEEGQPSVSPKQTTGETEKASSADVETEAGIPTPFWWILGAAVLAIIVILIYHVKKR